MADEIRKNVILTLTEETQNAGKVNKTLEENVRAVQDANERMAYNTASFRMNHLRSSENFANAEKSLNRYAMQDLLKVNKDSIETFKKDWATVQRDKIVATQYGGRQLTAEEEKQFDYRKMNLIENNRELIQLMAMGENEKTKVVRESTAQRMDVVNRLTGGAMTPFTYAGSAARQVLGSVTGQMKDLYGSSTMGGGPGMSMGGVASMMGTGALGVAGAVGVGAVGFQMLNKYLEGLTAASRQMNVVAEDLSRSMSVAGEGTSQFVNRFYKDVLHSGAQYGYGPEQAAQMYQSARGMMPSGMVGSATQDAMSFGGISGLRHLAPQLMQLKAAELDLYGGGLNMGRLSGRVNPADIEMQYAEKEKLLRAQYSTTASELTGDVYARPQAEIDKLMAPFLNLRNLEMSERWSNASSTFTPTEKGFGDVLMGYSRASGNRSKDEVIPFDTALKAWTKAMTDSSVRLAGVSEQMATQYQANIAAGMVNLGETSAFKLSPGRAGSALMQLQEGLFGSANSNVSALMWDMTRDVHKGNYMEFRKMRQGGFASVPDIMKRLDKYTGGDEMLTYMLFEGLNPNMAPSEIEAMVKNRHSLFNQPVRTDAYNKEAASLVLTGSTDPNKISGLQGSQAIIESLDAFAKLDFTSQFNDMSNAMRHIQKSVTEALTSGNR